MTDPDSSGVAGKGSSIRPDTARIEIDLVRDGDEVGQGALEAWREFEPLDAAVEAAANAVARCDEIDVGWAAATVALATDARVRELNGAYRGKDKATNVLSFPASSAVVPDQPVFLGDIILAAETVAREAVEQGIEPRHHLQHLVVHGLLHLLGFDHETAAEAEEMEGLETVILATIGIADPYAEPALIEDDR